MKTKRLDMNGLAVRDIDGARVGEIVDFYFDARTNEPEWLVVEAGGHRTVVVPLDDVARIEDGLKTPYPKAMILDSPHAEGASLDKRTEKALNEFYHQHRAPRGAHDQKRSPAGNARLRSWKAWKAA